MSNSLFPGGGALSAYFNSINRKPRIEIYEDSKEPKNKWRWRIWMSSDIIGASSQGYSTRALCLIRMKCYLHLSPIPAKNYNKVG